MVSMLKAITWRKQQSEMRPLDVGRDLGQLRQLIAEVFHNDWSPEGDRTLRDLRYMHWLSPFVWLVARIDPEFNDSMTGIVWIEQGRLVGNVTVGRIYGARWFVSNVAVRETYRGRGIGRRMLAAAIDLIQHRGGREVILQARADNPIALRLYHSFGFKTYSTVTQMQLPVVPPSNPHTDDESPLPDDYLWRSLRHEDWREEYELALATIPKEKQRVHPIYQSRYNLGIDERLKRWLDNLVHLRSVCRWAIAYQQEIVATLTVITQRLSEPHQLKIIVHPAQRGQVETAMVSRALTALCQYPPRAIYCRVNATHPEAITALAQADFAEARTLNQMRAEFK